MCLLMTGLVIVEIAVYPVILVEYRLCLGNKACRVQHDHVTRIFRDTHRGTLLQELHIGKHIEEAFKDNAGLRLFVAPSIFVVDDGDALGTDTALEIAVAQLIAFFTCLEELSPNIFSNMLMSLSFLYPLNVFQISFSICIVCL